MDVVSRERALKKKLQSFLQELQQFGTLGGFRHFQCYIRSKEELLISINNNLQGNSLPYHSSLAAQSSRNPALCPSDSFSSSRLPYDKHSLVLSHNSQVHLSGMKDRGVGLPPASPSEQECTPDADVTLFLIAGYARYSCPYVWVRSNHDRLLKLSNDMINDRDSPLRLKSTARWKDEDVLVTDVIAEVVRLCTYPSPWNPFEIDLQHFQSLSQPDQLLCSAAMVACLQKIVVHTPDSRPYLAKVFEDLQLITKFHFTSLKEVALAANIPILQQNSVKTQQKYQDQQKHQQNDQPRHSLQTRYPRIPTTAPSVQTSVTQHHSHSMNTSGVIYGHELKDVFPGHYNRMPAPSLI